MTDRAGWTGTDVVEADVPAGDVIVVGAGAAGLTAALDAAPRAVTVVTSAPVGTAGATPWAQGGIAAALHADDTPELHAADTLTVGGQLGDPDAVAALTREGPRRVRELIARGARFALAEDGSPQLGREAGHGRRRILHAGGDATGAEVARALAAAARRAPHIQLVEGVTAEALSVDAEGAVGGVLVRTADGRLVRMSAPAMVLATGGAAALWARTTNPPGANGDGIALAAGIGAELVDLEFVQFHPTALAIDADPLPLLTEALRGEGATLLDAEGVPMLAGLHPDGDLAPRDVVARVLWQRLAEGDAAFLDVSRVVELRARFPGVAAACGRVGLDPERDHLPVTPAAHYHMGGVAVDRQGRTSVPGLWACGEVAAGGVHGANRLASNSLLEALVVGARVAVDLPAAACAPLADGAALDLAAGGSGDAGDPTALVAVRQVLWQHVGLARDGAGLAAADLRLRALADHPDPAVLRATTVARLVVTAAAARCETRGAHVRTDHPATRPAWRRHLWLRWDGGPVIARAGSLRASVAA